MTDRAGPPRATACKATRDQGGYGVVERALLGEEGVRPSRGAPPQHVQSTRVMVMRRQIRESAPLL